jgi:hypothetical protein
VCSFLRVAPPNCLHLCPFPIRATYPTHPITLFQCAVQIMKLLFTQFSSVSCYCPSVSQHPFWNTLCRCSARPISNTEPKTGLRKLRFHLDASGYWSTPLARHGCTWPVQSVGLKLPFVLKATRCRDSSVVLVTGLRGAISSRVTGPLSEMSRPASGSNGTAVSYRSVNLHTVSRLRMSGVVFKHGVRRSSRSLSPLHGGGYLQSRTADRGWVCYLDLGEGIASYLRNQQVPKMT